MTEITDSQRAAWAEVQDQAGDVADALRPLLPVELTSPQPAMPTEFGAYHDVAGRLWWLDENGLNNPHGTDIGFLAASPYAPFTRLVPERAPVTRDQVQALVTQWYNHGKNAPLVDGILALVNGDDL